MRSSGTPAAVQSGSPWQAGESVGEMTRKIMLMENDDGEFSMDVMNIEDWKDLDVEMVLDSGCCAHIMDANYDAPGYALKESEGSRQGRGFIVGNGERIPNEGEVRLNLEAPNGCGSLQPLQSTFQSAKVTRPLMSVSQICDHGFTCVFDKERATVMDSDMNPKFVCERRGGLYMAPMKLKAPSPFPRQEP